MKENKADITVIITSFGCEPFIKKCIESVALQSLPVNEVIIIDDASVNFDLMLYCFVLNQYQHLSIRIISTIQNTGGPSIPRNIGIENSESKYVAFLDGDDIWYKDKIKFQYPLLESYKAVCSNFDVYKNGKIGKISIKKEITYKKMLTRCYVGSPTGIIKKDIAPKFKEIDNEDYQFWIDVSKITKIAAFKAESLACYRIRNNSRSSLMKKNFYGIKNILFNESPNFYLFYFTLYILKVIYRNLKFYFIGVRKDID